jgi:hypothetical protein
MFIMLFENARCLFSKEDGYKLALIGVTGFIDQFDWRMDYSSGFLSVG